MILMLENIIQQRNKPLILCLMLMACSLLFIMYHQVWHTSKHRMQTASRMVKNDQSLQNLRYDVTDLSTFKEQFDTSIQKIERWMHSINPNQKLKEIKNARKAQVRLFSYLNKELNTINDRFKKIPSFADLKKIEQEIMRRQMIIQAYQDIQRTRKAKILIKNV